MKVLAIIPARYNSTRLPGKPLLDIQGKSMIQRVYEQVSVVFRDVYVSTDDTRIVDAVKAFRGKVILTSETCKNGTERCIEALKIIENHEQKTYDIVLNVQGDMPFLPAINLTKILIPFYEEQNCDIATIVTPIQYPVRFDNEDEVKALVQNGRAYAFFRKAGPASPVEDMRFHLGIYAFTREVLLVIEKMEETEMERELRLEQVRWLQNDMIIEAINGVWTPSIDTLEDY